MPSPVGHGLIGAAIAYAVLRQQASRRNLKILAAAAVASVPDVDFLLIAALGLDPQVHRGFSHSLFFAIACGILIALGLGRSRSREALAYSLALASHGILDALTTVHGKGVSLLWPIFNVRWKLGLFEFPGVPLFAENSHAQLLSTAAAAALTEIVILAPLLAVATFFCVILRSEIRRTSA